MWTESITMSMWKGRRSGSLNQGKKNRRWNIKWLLYCIFNNICHTYCTIGTDTKCVMFTYCMICPQHGFKRIIMKFLAFKSHKFDGLNNLKGQCDGFFTYKFSSNRFLNWKLEHLLSSWNENATGYNWD